MAGYYCEERGSRNSLEYRLFFKDGSGKVVSPMHDIPMLASKISPVCKGRLVTFHFKARGFTTWLSRSLDGPMLKLKST